MQNILWKLFRFLPVFLSILVSFLYSYKKLYSTEEFQGQQRNSPAETFLRLKSKQVNLDYVQNRFMQCKLSLIETRSEFQPSCCVYPMRCDFATAWGTIWLVAVTSTAKGDIWSDSLTL